MTWPGTIPLTTLGENPTFDLPPSVGQRTATYRFALTNGVTGEILGDIHPLRGASLTHDTARTVKRQLTLALGKTDTADVNPITDRINVYMVTGGVEYPLGRYMFVDASRNVFTAGRLGQMQLADEMFLVDQQVTSGVNGVGKNVTAVIVDTVADLPIDLAAEPSPFQSSEAWGIGTGRGQILEALAVSGDYWSPWFDNHGVLRFLRTFNPADQVPDINLDDGFQVLQASILETDDLLTAPNTFLVISNAADDTTAPVIGRASVPPSAPHSVTNRGFEIVDVRDLQLSDSTQAAAVAQGLAQRQTIFEKVALATAPDPRHDSYNVIQWQGDLWLELAWSMGLEEGEAMTHTLRRSYGL